MNITRPKDLSVIADIAPHIIASDPKLVGIVQTDIANLMTHNPSSLLFLTWYDDDDKGGAIRGFMVAVDPGPSYPYVNIFQVWGHSDNPRNWIHPFFARLVLWAVAHGKEYLRAETQRDTDAVYRRFHFEPHMQIVKYDLSNSDVYQKLVDIDKSEEAAHGQ